jgi:hypothetical protein
MNNKHKSISPSTIQANTQHKTICIDEKLDVISQLEKGEQIYDIRVCRNVRLPHSRICTNHDKADRTAESATQELRCFFVQQDYHSPNGINCTKNCGCESLTFLLHTYLLTYLLTHSLVKAESFLRS